MSHRLPTKKSLRFFTMVEMITVMIVLGILVTITMSVASVDSTKANSQIVAGAITYASSYALGNTNATDYDNNGYDQAIEVEFDANEIKVTLKNEDGTDEELKTYNLSKGSYISDISIDGSSQSLPFSMYFTNIGEPLSCITTKTVINKNTEISITKKNTTNNNIKVYVRPFTGKVTFYE